MRIIMRERAGVCILDLDGKIVMGTGDVMLQEAVDSLLAENKKKILLNFSNISYMDSSGIGQLVQSFRQIKEAGGQLKIVNISNKIYNTFTIMRLLPIFEVYSDEDEAIKSF